MQKFGLSEEECQTAEEKVGEVYESVSRIRNLKAEYNLAANRNVGLIVKAGSGWAEGEGATLALLCGAREVEFSESYEAPKGTPVVVTAIGEVYLPLEGLIDLDAERKRIGAEIAKVKKELTRSEGMLGNPKFVENAKPEIVKKEQGRLEEWREKMTQLEELLEALS